MGTLHLDGAPAIYGTASAAREDNRLFDGEQCNSPTLASLVGGILGVGPEDTGVTRTDQEHLDSPSTKDWLPDGLGEGSQNGGSSANASASDDSAMQEDSAAPSSPGTSTAAIFDLTAADEGDEPAAQPDAESSLDGSDLPGPAESELDDDPPLSARAEEPATSTGASAGSSAQSSEESDSESDDVPLAGRHPNGNEPTVTSTSLPSGLPAQSEEPPRPHLAPTPLLQASTSAASAPPPQPTPIGLAAGPSMPPQNAALSAQVAQIPRAAVSAEAEKPRKRRRDLMPRVSKKDRCGTCHTCLHPSLKKACLTKRTKFLLEMPPEARVEALKQLDKDTYKPVLPRELALGTSSGSGNIPAAAASAAAAGLNAPASAPRAPNGAVGGPGAPERQQDPFTREMLAILLGNGGVRRGCERRLKALMAREAVLERRVLLLTVLEQSEPQALKELVRLRGLETLQSWLTQAVAADKPKMAARVLAALQLLPVTRAVLQSTGAGKTVAKLKKNPNAELAAKAAGLVEHWRKAVREEEGDAGSGAGAAAGKAAAPGVDGKVAGPKREREPVTTSAGTAAPAAKKPRPEDGNQNRAPSAQQQQQLQAQQPGPLKRLESTDSKSLFRSGSSDLAAKLSAGLKAKQDGKPLAVAVPVDDEAMFKKKPVPVPAKAPIKILDVESSIKAQQDTMRLRDGAGGSGSIAAASDPRAGKGAESASGPEASAGAKPEAKPEGPPRRDDFMSKLLAEQRFGIGGSLSGVTRIGGSTSIGGGFTRIGSGSSRAAAAPQLSAAERAAAAAARVPDPEPAPRKEHGKKLSWKEEDELVQVRWFRKTDIPSAVRSDHGESPAAADADAEAAADALLPGQPPTEFRSRSKREHEDEAAALRQSYAMGEDMDEDGPSGSGTLPGPPAWGAPKPMAARTAWYEPQEWVPPPDHPAIAVGEESTERRVQEERLRMVPEVYFAHPSLAPETPLEPPPEYDYGQTQVSVIPFELPPPAETPQPSVPQPFQQPAPQTLPQYPIQQQYQQGPSTYYQGPGGQQGMQPAPEYGQAGQAPGQAQFGGGGIPQQAPPPASAGLGTATLAGIQLDTNTLHQLSMLLAQATSQPQASQAAAPVSYAPGPSHFAPQQHQQQQHQQPQHHQPLPQPVTLPPPPQQYAQPHSTAGHQNPPPITLPPPVSAAGGRDPASWGGHQGAPAADPQRDYPPRDDRYARGSGRPERGSERRAERDRGGDESRGRGRGRGGGGGRGSRTPCLFFNTPQGCRKGDRCPFAHVRSEESPETVAENIRAISQRRHGERERERERDSQDRSPPRERSDDRAWGRGR